MRYSTDNQDLDALRKGEEIGAGIMAILDEEYLASSQRAMNNVVEELRSFEEKGLPFYIVFS